MKKVSKSEKHHILLTFFNCSFEMSNDQTLFMGNNNSNSQRTPELIQSRHILYRIWKHSIGCEGATK